MTSFLGHRPSPFHHTHPPLHLDGYIATSSNLIHTFHRHCRFCENLKVSTELQWHHMLRNIFGVHHTTHESGRGVTLWRGSARWRTVSDEEFEAVEGLVRLKMGEVVFAGAGRKNGVVEYVDLTVGDDHEGGRRREEVELEDSQEEGGSSDGESVV